MILHPELLRNTRGPARLRNAIKEYLGFFETVLTGVPLEELVKTYPVASRHIDMWLKDVSNRKFDSNSRVPKDKALEATFMTSLGGLSGVLKSCMNSPVYMIGKDFFDVLKNVDIAVPTSVLPKQAAGFVQFPYPIDVSKDADHVSAHGFYYLIKDDVLCCLPVESVDDFLPNWDPMHIVTGIGSVSLVLKDGMTVYDTVMELPDDCGVISRDESFSRMISIVFNCVLYIHSQQPDLQKTRPESAFPSQTQARKWRAKGGTLNEFTIPVIRVSWNYRKPIVYSKDSTWVESHPRWQPCGPQWSQVKLIWVTAHERQLNKPGLRTELNNEEANQSPAETHRPDGGAAVGAEH